MWKSIKSGTAKYVNLSYKFPTAPPIISDINTDSSDDDDDGDSLTSSVSNANTNDLLIENNNLREGVIVKFNDKGHWKGIQREKEFISKCEKNCFVSNYVDNSEINFYSLNVVANE